MARSVDEYLEIRRRNKQNYMKFQLGIMQMPKIDLTASDAGDRLAEHMQKFQEICYENGELPSLANYALSLHMSRQELQAHLRGQTNISPEAYYQLHMANDMLGATLEDSMLNGNNHVVGSIFVAKNNFGYKDQSETLVIHQHQGLTAEQLKQIADGLPDVIDVEYTEVKEDDEEKDDDPM